MRRISAIGFLANLVALALLATTAVALAIPSGSELSGDIRNFYDSSVSLTGAFINTQSLIDIASQGFYAVYATVTRVLSGVEISSLDVVGYVLQSAVDSISSTSLPSSGFSLPDLRMFDVPSFLGNNSSAVLFQVTSVEGVPEPSTVAILVTATAGLATLLRRRKLRRAARQATQE